MIFRSCLIIINYYSHISHSLSFNLLLVLISSDWLRPLQLDSLKYLGSCMLHYGADRMFKHANAIWSALKDVIFSFSPQGTIFASVSKSAEDVESQESQIAKEALICLQVAISQLNYNNSEPFISLILVDRDVEKFFASVCLVRSYLSISKESRRQLSSLGSILSTAAKTSPDCCSRVLQKFLPRLMNVLGVSTSDSSHSGIKECKTFSNILNFGALYLCVELLASCRDLTMVAQDLSPQVPDIWWYLLKDFSGPLTLALKSALVNAGTVATGPEHMSCVGKALLYFPSLFMYLTDRLLLTVRLLLISIFNSLLVMFYMCILC